jgi:putative peptidoglycan lipid II flippase
VLIGAITMLARVIGFGRQVVFAHTVQASCLGTAYTTANMVPNIIYDIVMGGALTAVVVPVLAGPAGAQAPDREQVRQTSSALLSWAVLLLVPVSALVAVTAQPLVSVLLGGTPGCPRAAMVWCSRRRSCCMVWPSCCTASCSRTAGSPRPRWRRCFPAWSSSARTSGSARRATATRT